MLEFFRSLIAARRSSAPAPPVAARVALDERIYAIGDIHGRADLLTRLMARIDADAAARAADGRRVRLVFLGDYVDRGDDSRGVLAMLRAIREAHGDAVSFLRGNHEAALASFLDDPLGGVDWLSFGGRQTLASYGISLAAAPDARAIVTARDALAEALAPDRAFLDAALSMLARSGDVVFVHAGLDPNAPLDAQPEAALLWGEIGFDERGGHPGLLVVHGHFDAPTPRRVAGRLCVDTGAYYSGVLTAARLDAEIGFLST